MFSASIALSYLAVAVVFTMIGFVLGISSKGMYSIPKRGTLEYYHHLGELSKEH